MRIIKVLIASPSDVGEERKIAESVVHDWHKRNKREGIMLVPVLWELDAAPEMGDTPQGIINRQIVDECKCVSTSSTLTSLFHYRHLSSEFADVLDKVISKRAIVVL